MRGDGSIKEVKDNEGKIKKGVWRVTVSLGQNPITGKRERVSRIVHGSKEDARAVRDSIIRDSEAGLAIKAKCITFQDFAEAWQKRRTEAGDLAERSLEESAYYSKYLGNLIGSLPVSDISAYVVESVLQSIRDDRRKPDGTTISNRTLKKYYTYLHAILQKAVDYDLLIKNPCDKVKPPKLEQVQRRSLTPAEFARLVQFTDAEETKAIRCEGFASDSASFSKVARLNGVRLAVAAGLRLGEIRGLAWEHVDFRNNRIHIVRTVTRSGAIKPPKSDAGTRWVTLDATTAAKLAQWKNVQSDWLASNGIPATQQTPIVCDQKGETISQNSFESWWQKWRKEAGFPGLKFHELRHTQASLLLANGADVKTVQKRLGHSSVSLTLNCYAHALDEGDKVAANVIGGISAPAKTA